MNLSQKDLLELKYWFTAEAQGEDAKQKRYLEVFGVCGPADYARELDVLEIGCGPRFGMLPYFHTAHRQVAVDPLLEAYELAGVRSERREIFLVNEQFESWDTNNTFDVILCANALDHGSMGFHLLPKISRMLKPGGRALIHVHLRPKELLNLVHDHALTLEDYERNLGFTTLQELSRDIFEFDVDEQFCKALVVQLYQPQPGETPAPKAILGTPTIIQTEPK